MCVCKSASPFCASVRLVDAQPAATSDIYESFVALRCVDRCVAFICSDQPQPFGPAETLGDKRCGEARLTSRMPSVRLRPDLCHRDRTSFILASFRGRSINIGRHLVEKVQMLQPPPPPFILFASGASFNCGYHAGARTDLL